MRRQTIWNQAPPSRSRLASRILPAAWRVIGKLYFRGWCHSSFLSLSLITLPSQLTCRCPGPVACLDVPFNQLSLSLPRLLFPSNLNADPISHCTTDPVCLAFSSSLGSSCKCYACFLASQLVGKLYGLASLSPSLAGNRSSKCGNGRPQWAAGSPSKACDDDSEAPVPSSQRHQIIDFSDLHKVRGITDLRRAIIAAERNNSLPSLVDEARYSPRTFPINSYC